MWNAKLEELGRTLASKPHRGIAAEMAMVLAAALREITRLRYECRELQRQVDNATFRGAVIGPGGNLGPPD